jgi:hypothetical protein
VKNLVILVMMCLIGWKAYVHYYQGQQADRSIAEKGLESSAGWFIAGCEYVVQVRWADALFADDLLRRGDLFLEELSGDEDGWEWEWEWGRGAV